MVTRVTDESSVAISQIAAPYRSQAYRGSTVEKRGRRRHWRRAMKSGTYTRVAPIKPMVTIAFKTPTSESLNEPPGSPAKYLTAGGIKPSPASQCSPRKESERRIASCRLATVPVPFSMSSNIDDKRPITVPPEKGAGSITIAPMIATAAKPPKKSNLLRRVLLMPLGRDDANQRVARRNPASSAIHRARVNCTMMLVRNSAPRGIEICRIRVECAAKSAARLRHRPN